MLEPVYAKHHMNSMDFSTFTNFVYEEIKKIGEPFSGFNDAYWKSEEWQNTLLEEFNDFSKKCNNETEWDTAVNSVSIEFLYMRKSVKNNNFI